MRVPSLIPGLSARVPGIPVTVSKRFFFDRATVKSALSTAMYEGCWRSSILVRRTAAKSIKKVGAARPRLKIMSENEGVPMSVLLKLPGIKKSTRRALELRIAEIKFPPSSPPGSPPFTHVPSDHMLGFRRNLYNAMDPSMTSAVAGPSKRGKNWTIPHLHEFGGTKALAEYVWTPKYPRYTKVLTKWADTAEPLGGQWVPTGRTEEFRYPPRPYMLPALQRSLPKIASMFAGKFVARRGTATRLVY
jgi:hypothetical protein